MKKVILLFALVLAFTACKEEEAGKSPSGTTTISKKIDNTNVPADAVHNAATANSDITGNAKMEFEESEYNFGTVQDGEVVEHVYKFKNTGTEALVITSAKGSCGCTAPDWPKEPILPGENGEIKVKFDSKGKGAKGGKKERKNVTIFANTNPGQTKIFIAGTVEKKD